MKPTIIIITLLLSTSILCAQHTHSYSTEVSATTPPPNGGVVQKAGKYKIEMVVNLFLKQNQITLYLYKGDFKPLTTEDINGSITITTKNGEKYTQPLKAAGDVFVATLKNKEPFEAIVKLSIKGKEITAHFHHGGMSGHHNNSEQYVCPMHPDITSDSPGNCPKCGMKLEKSHHH